MTNERFVFEGKHEGDPVREVGPSTDELGSLPVVHRTDDGSWRLNITPGHEVPEAAEGEGLSVQQQVVVRQAGIRLVCSASRTGQRRRITF